MRTVNRVQSIQWLRAIAVLAVVIRHSTATTEKYGMVVPFFTGADVGRWGVDLFFLISGFIMVFTTRNHAGAWADTLKFWKRRVFRIVPLYWIITTVVIALGAQGIGEYKPAFWHVVASYLFIPWAKSSGDVSPALGVGWSLNFEMYFYLAFGLVMLLPKKTRIITLSAWASLSALAGVWCVSEVPIVRMLCSEMLLEFLAGALIGWAWLGGLHASRTAGSWLVALGAALLLAADYFHPDVTVALKFGTPSAMLLFGIISLEGSGVSFKAKLPALLGDASYSIYLSHIIALAGIGRVFQALQLSDHLPSTMLVMTDILIVVTSGVALYFIVEKPLHDRFSRSK